jgi:hypothetical protein
LHASAHIGSTKKGALTKLESAIRSCGELR